MIGKSKEVYRAANRDGTNIEWHCILCEHLISLFQSLGQWERSESSVGRALSVPDPARRSSHAAFRSSLPIVPTDRERGTGSRSIIQVLSMRNWPLQFQSLLDAMRKRGNFPLVYFCYETTLDVNRIDYFLYRNDHEPHLT